MANTLELKHLFYGFEKEGVETVKSIDDLETVIENKLQAIVWEDGPVKLVVAIMEISLNSTTSIEKAERKLKNLSKQHGVENVRVKPVPSYGGRHYR